MCVKTQGWCSKSSSMVLLLENFSVQPRTCSYGLSQWPACSRDSPVYFRGWDCGWATISTGHVCGFCISELWSPCLHSTLLRQLPSPSLKHAFRNQNHPKLLLLDNIFHVKLWVNRWPQKKLPREGYSDCLPVLAMNTLEVTLQGTGISASVLGKADCRNSTMVPWQKAGFEKS